MRKKVMIDAHDTCTSDEAINTNFIGSLDEMKNEKLSSS